MAEQEPHWSPWIQGGLSCCWTKSGCPRQNARPGSEVCQVGSPEPGHPLPHLCAGPRLVGRSHATRRHACAQHTHDTHQLTALADSQTSRCTEVKTLEGDSEESAGRGGGSILTRRLGLIVGSAMGFVVFVVLVSVLGYLKIKKQRQVASKRDQPLPQEYISYRHFSLAGVEPGTTASLNC
ncbi:uncharacterized protein LOC120348993 [Nilaparvata lugens]|uniref:uncharacterized protein LOC120348993 n=1 Tax=Nilaparvata lugens TaxID=108931 RepID=UPI00193D42BD|nr:uncharacterized protein LOC120348993 [Nilaparvata lugens]